MTKEEILKEVEKIEELARKRDLDSLTGAVQRMSTCDDLCTLQTFLSGLALKLDAESTVLLNIWSLAYGIKKKEDADAE